MSNETDTRTALNALFGPRIVTNGVSSVREYCADMMRYTNAATVTQVTCPKYVTDPPARFSAWNPSSVLPLHARSPGRFPAEG